jgi:gamma-butyrobetaine dioxygenase
LSIELAALTLILGQCRICIDQHSGQKSFETAAIDPIITAQIAKVDEDGAVTLTWHPDLPGHDTSTYSRSWLESVAAQTTQPSRAVASTAHRNLQLWEYSSDFAGNGLEFFDYADYLGNPRVFNNAMRKLGSWGLIFLENVPQDETAVERIAEAIGPLRNTFYGRTWDVKSKPQAENVAYTAHHLGLHMDLLYMKNPPGK